MHSALPVRKLIYEIARNLDKSVGQTVFCCVKYITKRAEFKTNFLRLNLFENFTVYGRFLCLLYKINGAYAEICMRNMNVHIF